MRKPSIVVSVLAVLALSACATPPQERFFTLAAQTPAAQGTGTAGPGATTATFSIVVGPVTVPDMVDRPQLVLRSSQNRVEIVEQARWAAPLKSEIPRVIAEHLSLALAGARTSTSDQRAAAVSDYRVLVDIQRFDSVPGVGATVQALWSITSPGRDPLTGRSLATEAAGPGYEALVAAHGRALATISQDIASAINVARARKP